VNDRVHISGYALQKLGWKKSGFEWRRGFGTIVYDGCDWLYCEGVAGIVFTEEGGVRVTWKKVEFVDEIKQKK